MKGILRSIHPVELLAPAGNLAIGRAALHAGADAVYIGAERFGARTAAGNSMEDIATLVQEAHALGARVYLTLNTLLFDSELAAAQQTAFEAYEAGVDALIVQDMAFTQLDLPPIALHASTQTFNLTPERAAFLAAAGFSRLVVERGASLEQIKAIRAAIPEEVELEAFVHGAICVSYSGQCYLGHAVCGRGGNRGACAQPCRAQYNLYNNRGELLMRDRTLLSVRDLNLSDHLEEVIAAGVCSLKIEGRLKEESYVVNNTAHYHRRLQELGVQRTSEGVVQLDFEPNPEKSFSRGFTTYFWTGRHRGVMAPEARSIGEKIGQVERCEKSTLTLRLNSGIELHNGDGLCFIGSSGRLEGARVNRVEGNRVTLNKSVELPRGAALFRNADHSFHPTAQRYIEVTVAFTPTQIRVTDRSGHTASVTLRSDSERAANRELAARNIRNALMKSGGTIFRTTEVTLPSEGDLPFLPASELNALRRTLLEQLQAERIKAYQRPTPYHRPSALPTLPPGTATDFRANVSNEAAAAFYRSVGSAVEEMALEAQRDPIFEGREVMRTPYCLRREMGTCLREHPELRNEKLYLENNGTRLELVFHCGSCEMGVIYRGR